VTYATSPATEVTDCDVMSSGDTNGSEFLCKGNSKTGDVSVWNVERQLEKKATFNIKSCEKNVLKHYEMERELDIGLSALCTFKKETIAKLKDIGLDKPGKSTSVSGNRIAAGVRCSVSSAFEEQKQAFEMKPDEPKCLLVLFAVTEAFKTMVASKSSTAATTTMMTGSLSNTANGSASEETMNSYPNSKNGSSLITIHESSYEERFDGFDDILKFMDNKDSVKSVDSHLVLGPAQKNSQWTFIPQAKADTSEMDSLKSLATFNGPSTSPAQLTPKQNLSNKSKPDNEIICFPIQSVELPVDNEAEIKDIFTSSDNRYLVIVIKSKQQQQQQQLQLESDVDYMETDETHSPVQVQSVLVLVYEIDDKGLLIDNVVCERKFVENNVPIEFCILPKFDSNCGSSGESNALVITCADGSIKVLSITTLKTLSEAKVQGEKFVSSVYCKNLERLCACTATGTLHFYTFYDLDNDSSDELEDEMLISSEIASEKKFTSEMPSTSGGGSSSSSSSTNVPGVESNKQLKTDLIANRKELSSNDLKTLYSLTLFDDMLTPYSAEVPGCWTELVQAKRRHPQNLTPGGEDIHLIRTWRLHNDVHFDEHLIELSLSKATSLGHVDFKFSILQPCSNPPAIQVTLLKQKSIGLCCRRKQNSSARKVESEVASSIDVDDNINFNLNSSGNSSTNAFYNSTVIENPVLSEEYLQARNAEILAGPIELSSCMDLNEQGGTVTFVSPKLLKSKSRNYLIHLKTMTDVSKEGHVKTRGKYFALLKMCKKNRA
jgi:baculoviral IAP repeat-containing protein 6